MIDKPVQIEYIGVESDVEVAKLLHENSLRFHSRRLYIIQKFILLGKQITKGWIQMRHFQCKETFVSIYSLDGMKWSVDCFESDWCELMFDFFSVVRVVSLHTLKPNAAICHNNNYTNIAKVECTKTLLCVRSPMIFWNMFKNSQLKIQESSDGCGSAIADVHDSGCIIFSLTRARRIHFWAMHSHGHSYQVFLDNSVQRGKGVMRLTLCKALPRETRPDHNTGNCVPLSFWQVCGFYNVSPLLTM